MELYKLNCYGFKYYSSVQQKLDEYEAGSVTYDKAVNDLWNTLTEEEQENFQNEYIRIYVYTKQIFDKHKEIVCLFDNFYEIAGKIFLR